MAQSSDAAARATARKLGNAGIDPGSHKVSGMRGAETVEAAVTVAEGREEAVWLRFDPNVPAPGPAVAGGATTAVAPAQASTAAGNSSQATDAPAEEPKKSVLPKLGWISIGIGAASVAAGGVTGVLALQKESELEASGECVGGCKGSAARSDASMREEPRGPRPLDFARENGHAWKGPWCPAFRLAY